MDKMTNQKEDPEARDPNQESRADNPVVLTRLGKELRFKRLYQKFVADEIHILPGDDQTPDESNE